MGHSKSSSKREVWDIPGDPGLRLHAPNAGGPGLIPGQGTRSRMPQLRVHMPQLKDPATKRSRILQLRPWCSQINK